MTNLLTYIFLFSFFSFGFNIDLTKPNELMNVIYHETTNFEEHNRKEQNAKNRGETGAGIFSLKNFGNKNTNGMSKTEWIVANADKDTISTGTLGLVSDLYNTATKKGEGEPFIISSIVTGLIVTGSLYSIQDSARKIYAWVDGEGYKGNRTYIDPINGEVYTAEGNIKEGALELGVAATIGIAVKGVGKVVGKAKTTKISENKIVNYDKYVLNKMSRNDNHNFPILIDSLINKSDWKQIIGSDGNMYYKAIINGSKNGKAGFFEYVYDPQTGNITHRLFKEASKTTKNLR